MGQQTFQALAATDLTACQYHIARYSAANQVNIGSLATTEQLCGVIQSVTKSGQSVTVADFGESYVIAGGSITANALITTNGSGRAAAAGSSQMIIGRALEAAAADGNKIKCRLFTPYINS